MQNNVIQFAKVYFTTQATSKEIECHFYLVLSAIFPLAISSVFMRIFLKSCFSQVCIERCMNESINTEQ